MPRSLSPSQPTRRVALVSTVGAWVFAGCAGQRGAGADWTRRLAGDTVALLGEVHDNAALHRLRLDGLRQAVRAGWRPVLAMEQFDTDRQPDIDRARLERPHDADHLIAQAGGGEAGGGWDWGAYRPLIELAMAHRLPLRGANLSRRQARSLVRGGWSTVFDAAARRGLGLDGPLPARLQAAQEKAVDEGHCGALPAELLPGMARAQLARDAVMAQVLWEQALAQPGRGAVLVAGNGHIRRDIGVPAWLAGGSGAHRLWAVGFVEGPGDAAAAGCLYDAWVDAPAADRADPCKGLAAPPPPVEPASRPS